LRTIHDKVSPPASSSSSLPSASVLVHPSRRRCFGYSRRNRGAADDAAGEAAGGVEVDLQNCDVDVADGGDAAVDSDDDDGVTAVVVAVVVKGVVVVVVVAGVICR
jgi:hypothetical protein